MEKGYLMSITDAGVIFESVIPNQAINVRPSDKDLRDLFSEAVPKWHCDLSLSYRDVNSQASTKLVISPCISSGFLIRFCLERGGAVIDYFSLNESKHLNRYVLFDNGEYTISGLLVSADQALVAATDFMSTRGEMSEKIGWITEDDIPAGMHWLVSEDVL